MRKLKYFNSEAWFESKSELQTWMGSQADIERRRLEHDINYKNQKKEDLLKTLEFYKKSLEDLQKLYSFELAKNKRFWNKVVNRLYGNPKRRNDRNKD